MNIIDETCFDINPYDIHFWDICWQEQTNNIPELDQMCFAVANVSSKDSVLHVLLNEGTFAILADEEPYDDVQEFISFTEDVTLYSGLFKRTFRWGIDGRTWSEWIDLSISNLNKYVKFVDYRYVYVQFKYDMIESGMLAVRSVTLNWAIHEDKLEGFRPYPIAYERDKETDHYPVYDRPFTFNPYKQAATIKFQKDLSFLMNQMHGIQTKYFKALPDKRSADILFNEFSLSNVEETPYDIKFVVPNNEFPDNKLNFTPYGVDYEAPFEVHIDKRYYENVVSNDEHPRKRDIIYFPINDRLYQVSSTQIIRDFMQEPIYYKLSLVKYQPKSNIKEPDSIRETIQELTQGFDSLFGQEKENEMIKTVNPQQTVIPDAVYDPIREWMYPADFVISEELNNNGTKVAHFYYDFATLFQSLREYTQVLKYRVQPKLGVNDNITYTAWFRYPVQTTYTRPVNSISLINGNDITVKFDSMPQVKVDQWLGLTTINNNNFELFGQIIHINSRPARQEITIRVPNRTLNQANTNYPTWRTDGKLIAREVSRKNFLYGFSEESQKGIRIDILNNKYARVALNDMRFWFDLPRLEKDKWYAMSVNVSQLYNQVSFNLYVLSTNTVTLSNVYSYTYNNVAAIEFDVKDWYQILMSNMHLTNVRIMNGHLEQEKQSAFLNQNIIQDAHLGLVIDNAVPVLRRPYVGNVQ